MDIRIDPRGDLPSPFPQRTSFYHRSDRSLSRPEQKRSSAYGLPPSYPKTRPCYDWIFSSASNVHIAIDRSAFRQFVSFKSYVLTVADQRQVLVKGVGTVEIKIRRQPGRKESHRINLENVLYVPGWLCNIISDKAFLPAKDYEHTLTDFGFGFKKLENDTWTSWGYTENFCGLDKLVLSRKHDGRSPMLDDPDREIFSINVNWPQSQQDKWDRLVALEMKIEAEKHEALARAETAKAEEKKNEIGKDVDPETSSPGIKKLICEKRTGLREVDVNTATITRAASARVGVVKPATAKSAFREALLWRKSVEK